MYFKNRKNQNLFFQEWNTPKAKYNLIIIHGVNEHSGRYRDLILGFKKVFQNEFNIYAYDHRGHGQSQGRKGHINRFSDYSNDLNDFLQFIKMSNEGNDLPFIIFAHSMGGLIALDYITSYCEPAIAENIKCLVLSAPGLIPSLKVAWWKKLFTPSISFVWPTFSLPTTELGHRKDELCYNCLSARWFDEFNKARKRVMSKLSSISLPVLIFHSKIDALADIAGSEMLVEKINSLQKKLIILDTKNHKPYDIDEPDNDKEKAISDITTATKKFLKQINE